MGEILHLPAATAAYPDSSAELDRSEWILLLAIRWWVVDHRQGDDPVPRLFERMGSAGAEEAAYSIDRLMSVIARSARRPIAIHCPRCPGVSDDEKQLLNAASLAQAGKSDLAERALRMALISAHGAEFALGPLEGLAELFGAVGLIFRRRPPILPERGVLDAIDAWTPPSSGLLN